MIGAVSEINAGVGITTERAHRTRATHSPGVPHVVCRDNKLAVQGREARACILHADTHVAAHAAATTFDVALGPVFNGQVDLKVDRRGYGAGYFAVLAFIGVELGS